MPFFIIPFDQKIVISEIYANLTIENMELSQDEQESIRRRRILRLGRNPVHGATEKTAGKKGRYAPKTGKRSGAVRRPETT